MPAPAVRIAMPGAAPAEPAGLPGLLRLRRSATYAIELKRRRRGRRRGVVRLLPAVVPVTAAACTFYAFGVSVCLERLREPETLAAGIAAAGLCLVMLAGAGLAGLEAFGRERSRGTLDALVMTPVPRNELVWARLALGIRPQLIGAAAVAGALLAGALLHRSFGCWEYATGGVLVSAAVLGGEFLSLGGLAAVLGLVLGLRTKSPTAALAGTAGLVAAVLAAELAAVLALGPLLFWSHADGALELLEYALRGYVFEGFVPVLLALGTVNLLVARGLVRLAVRRFDEWAAGEPAGRRVRR